MIIGRHDTRERVLIIAEIGNNHEGRLDVARNMVREAASTGTDAVKFQTFRTEHYVSPADADRFRRLKGFELSRDAFRELAGQAREAGLLFLSTPFDLDSAAFLGEIADAIKIASGDNTFFPLLEAAAATGLPMLISSGLSTIETIHRAAARVENVWSTHGITQELAVLHCVSSYPVPPEQANLGAIRELERLGNWTVGYSDHTMGIDAAALSVAAGARIVEKHFTLAHDFSDFRDHQLSADPVQMAGLVQRIRSIEDLLGSGTKTIQPCETDAVRALRRSIAAARDLPAGICLSRDDITWLRPGGGIPPGEETRVLKRTLRCAVRAGDPIVADLLDGGSSA
jgi:sialic acid synthase SpsE